MSEAFMIGKVFDIKDKKLFNEYLQKASIIFNSFGGKTIVSSYNMNYEIVSPEGKKPEIVNVFYFESKKDLFDFYYSKEFSILIKEREEFCTSEVTLLYNKLEDNINLDYI